MSSLIYVSFIGSTKGRRKLLITTPDSTLERPRVHIRMKVLLWHILEILLLGPHGNDLHLGQKPKLGGRYAGISLIYISYFAQSFVYPYFAFFCCSSFISIS